MKQFLTVNFKWFVVIGIAIVAFMMWKGCGDNSVEVENEWKNRYDSMTAVNDNSERKVQVLLVEVNERNNREDSLQRIHEQDKQRWNADLNRLKRFSAGIKTAKINNDTAAYKLNCDSCGEMYEALYKDALVFEETAIDLLNEKDSTKFAMQEIIDEKDKQISVMQSTLDFANNTVIPQVRRRLEFYAGGGVIGNETTIFSGYSAGISMLNRRGQIYDGDVQWINGVRFYKVGAKLRLSFRKH